MLKQLFQRFFYRDNTSLIQALQSDPLLIDVRSALEFQEGSIDGAINIPIQFLNESMATRQKTDVVVTFCRMGYLSAKAVAILRKNGFEHAVDGGSLKNVQFVLSQIKQTT